LFTAPADARHALTARLNAASVGGFGAVGVLLVEPVLPDMV
jgi:hypothetical protein